MFDIGFWELMIVAIIALVVIGPERLPKFAYIAGVWVGKVQRFVQTTRADLEREFHAQEYKQFLQRQKEVEHLVDNIKQEISDIDSEKEHNNISNDIKD